MLPDRAQQAESERAMQQCYFLMQQALGADEGNLTDSALQLYLQAVELAVSIVCIYLCSVEAIYKLE